MIKFIADEWQNERHRERLAGRTIFVTTEDHCYEVSSIGMTTRKELRSTQEEADTRMFLHGPNAAAAGYRAVATTSGNTDVFVLLLTFKGFFSCPVFVKRSPPTRTVYTDVSRIVRMLGSKRVDLSLRGLHVFTGCDSVGAFFGKGEVTTSKLVKQNKSFQTLYFSQEIGMKLNLTVRDLQSWKSSPAARCTALRPRPIMSTSYAIGMRTLHF